MSKINKSFFLIFFLTFFFINTTCGPGDHKLTSKEIFGITVLAILFPSNANISFEPNDTKNQAFCINPKDNTLSPGNILESVIYQREDIDYFKVYFRNSRLALDYFISYSEIFHIVIENDSTILFDSRYPGSTNALIELNQIIQVPVGNSKIADARKIIFKDQDFLYLKFLHNENYTYPNVGGIYYTIKLINDIPNLSITNSNFFFRLTGEFEPCPK